MTEFSTHSWLPPGFDLTRRQRRKLDHAARVWLAVVGGTLVADAILLRHDNRSLTQCARDNKVVTAVMVALVCAHLLNRLGRFDPFVALARLVTIGVSRTCPGCLGSGDAGWEGYAIPCGICEGRGTV